MTSEKVNAGELTDEQIFALAAQWPCRENDLADHADFARAVIAADRALRPAGDAAMPAAAWHEAVQQAPHA